MPLYSYKCDRCGRSFEELCSVAGADKRCKEPCPGCGDNSVRRELGIPAVHMRYSPMHPRHMRGQRRSK